jgi:hypothetical protein
MGINTIERYVKKARDYEINPGLIQEASKQQLPTSYNLEGRLRWSLS